ncbi:phosphate ABC transporter substrate-binding protein (PhoT family) [Frondihabitans sp. PhB188]|uniref:phosphate ABC transporter substrate-binding protein PstS n=1 Tax=Frondihabitans sp. PhB188 TaxID=2485200 RepID=UPI000F46F702|nr:phosphate ABC transporter substrate-binding protein PstS [Frondihabitans sp. PhB188]ROQ37519.1 phosphate ABC transporter substrate-binding protein (PhoT family) [Frondihabitans sp. PhB188]
MNIKRVGSIAAIALVGTIALSSCASNEDAAPGSSSSGGTSLSGTINGIGSSAQGVAETTWAAGFQEANGTGVTVNYDPQGSGAGRTSFISGAADFAGSDAALSDDEIKSTFAGCAADSKAIDLPVYISPIAVAYNVDGLKDLILDADTIAGIFSGKITKWNDSAITKLNPDATLPSASITVVHRSDDSGTTQNFTEYLAAEAKSVWTKPASQTFPYSVGDAAKGTSGVADATKNSKNSITYIDESAATGLSVSQLVVGGTATKISADGAAAVVAKSPLVEGRADNDLAINIDRTLTDSGDWPMVLVSYMIACDTYKDSAKGDLVKAYATYAASDAGQKAAAAQAGSAPLDSDLAAKVATAAATIK